VVTSACVPSVVQVVAAPPLPVTPTEVVAASDDDDDEDNGPLLLQPMPDLQLAIKKPDLIVSEFTITPATPIMGQNVQVRIGAYNDGNAVSGQFTSIMGLAHFQLTVRGL
jgi:hypothetical protein